MINKWIKRNKFKRKGVYLHKFALCDSDRIGKGTRIWAFTHVLSDVTIGENCNICDFVFIENGVVIGSNVTIKSGVQIWKGVEINNNVFIGPNVTFTNDKYPKSGDHTKPLLTTQVHDGVSIGANATILPGIILGRFSVIAAGAIVTKNVLPGAFVKGVPAREYSAKIETDDVHG